MLQIRGWGKDREADTASLKTQFTWLHIDRRLDQPWRKAETLAATSSLTGPLRDRPSHAKLVVSVRLAT